MVHGVKYMKDSGRQLADRDPYLAPEFACFNCCYRGTRADLDQCGSCGEWHASAMAVCNDCFAYAVGAD
jgi:hypothetical protein